MPSRPLLATMGLLGAFVAACLVARAQTAPPLPLPPSPPASLSMLPASSQSGLAQLTVDQLAERVRAAEAASKSLGAQLEEMNRQHAEQVRQLQERLTELSRRVGVGSGGE